MAPLPFLTRDALKAAAAHPGARTIEFAELPPLGEVGVLALTGAELDALYDWARKAQKQQKKLINGGKKRLGFRAFVLARVLVDKAGARILTDEDAMAGWLDDLPAAALSAAIKTAFRVNGIGKEEEKEDDEDDDGEPAPAPLVSQAPAPAEPVDA